MERMTFDDWAARCDHFEDLARRWVAFGSVGVVGIAISLIVSYSTDEKLQFSIPPANWLNLLWIVSLVATLVSVGLMVYYDYKRDKFQKDNPKPPYW